MVTVNLVGNHISGNSDGSRFVLDYEKKVYNKLTNLASEVNKAPDAKSYKERLANFRNVIAAYEQADNKQQATVQVSNMRFLFQERDGHMYLMYNGKLSRLYIPAPLFNKITEMKTKGVAYLPIVRFFLRALKPHQGRYLDQDTLNLIGKYATNTYVDEEVYQQQLAKGFSAEIARERATFQDTFFTEEGLLGTYKVARNITEKVVSKAPVSQTIEDVDTITLSDGTVIKRSDLKVDKKGNHYYQTRVKGSFGPRITVSLEDVPEATTDKYSIINNVAEDMTFEPPVMGTSGDAFYCGDDLGHIIKVGKVHRLPSWDNVNTNNYESYVKGLHVGGFAYVRIYGAEQDACENCERVTHNIFIDPSHIGAVANYDNALRVIQYFVHSTMVAPNRGTYHSSKYAAMADEEWKKQVEEAYKTINEMEDRLKAAKEIVANDIQVDLN